MLACSGQAANDLEAVAEDEDSGAVRQEPAEDNDSNQINKWGFAPGEEDTQDLNMENKGKHMHHELWHLVLIRRQNLVKLRTGHGKTESGLKNRPWR